MSPTRTRPVHILDSEMKTIKSAIVGQDYLIKVRLPHDYANTTKKYPVLYLLDGDHAFAMATDIVQYLLYGEHIPDLLIVSPAYGSKESLLEGGRNRRNRDLFPFLSEASDEQPGANRFLRFFEQELIPFIENNYRIDSRERTLFGYSAGGFFALYTLFTNPELFKNYIVVDGFDRYFQEIEKGYARDHRRLPAKLWIAAPALDRAKIVAEFADTLKTRNYADFQVEFAWLSDLSHFAIGAEGLTKGLVAVFQG